MVDLVGEPIEGANVGLYLDWKTGFSEAGFFATKDDEPRCQTLTDHRGEFELEAQREITFAVRAESEQHAEAWLYDVQAGVEVLLTLAPAAALVGRVTRKVDGVPVPDAVVRVFHGLDGDTQSEGVTDRDGRYRVDQLMPGAAGVLVIPVGLKFVRWKELTLREGEATEYDVQVEEGWMVRGQVRDATNRAPVEGAEVSAWSFLGTTTKTNATGFYTLRGVRADGGRLQVRKKGYALTEIRYGAGEDPVDIELTPGITIKGRVVDGSGAGIAGARVGRTERNDEGPIHRMEEQAAITDAGGWYRFEGSQAGHTIALVGRGVGYGASWVSVDPGPHRAGDTVTAATLVLEEAAAIDGRIESADGDPVPGVGIYLSPMDREGSTAGPISPLQTGFGARTESDLDGNFRFRGLSPGPWAARLVTPNRAVLQERITLAPGEHADGVLWTLERGGILEGRVTGSDGSPIEGATVSLRPLPRRDIGYPAATTDSGGSFLIEGAVEGTYRLHASFRPNEDDGYEPFTLDEVIPDGRFIEIQLRRKPK